MCSIVACKQAKEFLKVSASMNARKTAAQSCYSWYRLEAIDGGPMQQKDFVNNAAFSLCKVTHLSFILQC
jgi:hypothetical protein